ncbi:hypothetical protein LINPERPRIM_LOCUS17073 [Linum perenne]
MVGTAKRCTIFGGCAGGTGGWNSPTHTGRETVLRISLLTSVTPWPLVVITLLIVI